MYYHVFHWWHQTLADLRFVLQNHYITKQVTSFLAELKAVVKTGVLKVPEAPTHPTPVCYDLSVRRVSNSQLSPTPLTPRGREKKEAIKMNFLSCSDHSWIKTTSIFSSLTFEFKYFFFCGHLSLQYKALVLWYTYKSFSWASLVLLWLTS